MFTLLIVSCLSAVALATPEADADAGYLGYGSGLGFSRTIHGLHKRSADAHVGYSYAYAPAVHNSYPNYPGYSGLGFSRTIHGLHKRSADAHYGYGYAPSAYNSYPNW